MAEFSEKYREFLLEARRLVLAVDMPNEEYKARLEKLRTGFMSAVTKAGSTDRSTWSDESQQEWGRVLGDLRRFAIQSKLIISNEDRGDDVLEKMVGFGEAQKIRAVNLIEKNTGMTIRSFSQTALRPAYDKAVEVLGKSSKSEQSEEEEFLGNLDGELSFSGAVKIIGDWLKGKSENSTPDETARRLAEEAAAKKAEAEKKAKAALPESATTTPDPRAKLAADLEKAKDAKSKALAEEDADALKSAKAEILRLEGELAALPESATTTPDPRAKLAADLEKAKADKAKALTDEDADALKSAKAEILRLEGELAALPESATTTTLATTIAACEAAEPESRLRKVLATYQGGGFKEEAEKKGITEADIFVRRVQGIQKK